MGLAEQVGRLQESVATGKPAPGETPEARAAAGETAPATAAAPAPSSPAPAAAPGTETPPPTAAPGTTAPPATPAGESTVVPATAAADGAQDAAAAGDDKRVQDAQRRMHDATTEAAQAKVALDKALAENVELKGKLEALAVSPDFVPVQMPADLPTDEAFQAELDAALTEYQTPKEGVDDATAFREYEKKRLDIQKRWIEADQTRKHITRENANRELAARSSVKSSINTWVAAQEPDLPIGWFWEVARRPDVINSVPAELTDPMARLDHQVKVALQICRAELNKIRGKAREAGAQAESINRAAGAVMPGGTSAAPASAAPPAPSGRKSFVDNVRSLAVQQPVQPS